MLRTPYVLCLEAVQRMRDLLVIMNSYETGLVDITQPLLRQWQKQRLLPPPANLPKSAAAITAGAALGLIVPENIENKIFLINGTVTAWIGSEHKQFKPNFAKVSKAKAAPPAHSNNLHQKRSRPAKPPANTQFLSSKAVVTDPSRSSSFLLSSDVPFDSA